MTWIVQLIRPPKVNDFRDGFFPRRCHYKKGAQELVDEVMRKGGEAVMMKERDMRHTIEAKTAKIKVAELDMVAADGSHAEALHAILEPTRCYRAFYTFYGSGMGYRCKVIEATSYEDAEQKLYKHLHGLAGQGEIEYTITDYEFSFRLYDSRKKVRL
jgi:hypothetical protein